MSFAKMVSVIALGLYSVGASAEEALSFQQCVELAKKNNANIQSAEETLQAKGYQVQSARGSYFPQITANLSYLQTGPSSGAFSSTTVTSNAATLNASQNLFNGFADVSKVTQAQEEKTSALAALQVVKANASFDLKTTFANLLYAKEAERLSKDFLKRREENLRMVELRYQNGRENKGSLLLSQAYLAQAKVDLLKSQNVRNTSQSDFHRVVGIDEDKEVEISDELPLQDPTHLLNVAIDFKKMVLSLPQHQQLLSQVRSADAARDIARSGFLPSINLTGSVGKVDDHFFPERDRWTVGANLSWSLFGGGKDYYGSQSSTATYISLQRSLTHLQRDQVAVLKKAHVGFIEAVADLKVSEAFLAAAKSRAEIARAKYNNGLMTFDEWDIIENDLINKSKSYLQARRQRILAEATWEQAQGIGVIP